MNRLVKLEKRLAGLVDRKLRRPENPTDPLELLPMILDAIEEKIVPAADGVRVFPYDRVAVQVCVEPGRRTAAETVFEHPPALDERVRERLREARCEVPDPVAVTVKIVEGAPPESWSGSPFRIECRARKPRKAEPAPAPSKAVPAVRLVVLAGSTGGRNHAFELERINVGRMSRVEDRVQGAARKNHLAFEDGDDEANATVSRAHAHLRWDASAGCFRLFDDGSAHGTRVLRGGRDLAVPRQGSRGVRLEHGDEMEFGKARVRFLAKW